MECKLERHSSDEFAKKVLKHHDTFLRRYIKELTFRLRVAFTDFDRNGYSGILLMYFVKGDWTYAEKCEDSHFLPSILGSILSENAAPDNISNNTRLLIRVAMDTHSLVNDYMRLCSTYTAKETIVINKMILRTIYKHCMVEFILGMKHAITIAICFEKCAYPIKYNKTPSIDVDDDLNDTIVSILLS